MSNQELDRMRQIINTSNQNDLQSVNNEKARQAEEEKIRTNAYNEKVKADQFVLDNSGARNLFRELRDSGFVKESDYPVYEEVPVYRKKFFGGEEFDHYEKRKIADYKPAILEEGPSSISLEFNYSTVYMGDGMDSTAYSEVTVAVQDGKLHLKNRGPDKGYPPKRYYFWTPIEEGKLVETIAEAIRKPIYHGHGG